MKRGAFTLMELLVSVVLIALITLFMYGAIASSRLTSKTLSKHAGAENNRTMLYELFYRDLVEALRISALPTQNRRFTVIRLQTRNSLYDIAAPYVIWYVHSQTKDLIRLESAQKISLPVSYEQKVFIHADRFAKEVEDFNLYTAVTDSNTSGASSSAPQKREESLSTQEENERRNEVLAAPEKPDRMLLYLNAPQVPRLLLDIAI